MRKQLCDHPIEQLLTFGKDSSVCRNSELHCLVVGDERDFRERLRAGKYRHPIDLATLQVPRLLETACHIRHAQVQLCLALLQHLLEGIVRDNCWQKSNKFEDALD